MYALVYWISDNKSSIVDISCVPEESRTVGHISSVLWGDNQRYPALVIKMGRTTKLLEKADTEFRIKLDTVQKAEAPLVSKRSRKLSFKAQAMQDSAKNIAHAFNEKPKLSRDQQKIKTSLKSEAKQLNTMKKRAAEDQAKSMLLTKRKLFDKNEYVSDSEGQDNNASEGGNEDDDSSADDYENDSDDSVDDLIVELPSQKNPTQEDCNRCMDLVQHKGQILNVIKVFSNFFGIKGSQESPNDSLNVPEPVQVTPGQKKVEISRGSGVWIKKASKTKLILDCGNDPYKLLRKLLTEIYGDQLKQAGLTALGQGKGKVGIDDTALNGIYGFIQRHSNIQTPPGTNRNGMKKKPFTYKAFVEAVNRKLGSCRRDRRGSKSSSVAGDSTKKAASAKRKRAPAKPSATGLVAESSSSTTLAPGSALEWAPGTAAVTAAGPATGLAAGAPAGLAPGPAAGLTAGSAEVPAVGLAAGPPPLPAALPAPLPAALPDAGPPSAEKTPKKSASRQNSSQPSPSTSKQKWDITPIKNMPAEHCVALQPSLVLTQHPSPKPLLQLESGGFQQGPSPATTGFQHQPYPPYQEQVPPVQYPPGGYYYPPHGNYPQQGYSYHGHMYNHSYSQAPYNNNNNNNYDM